MALRTRVTRGPAGDHTPGSVGPKSATVGAPKAAARCVTPESFPMKAAASALWQGDEDRWGVLKQGVKTKLQEFLPHREG